MTNETATTEVAKPIAAHNHEGAKGAPAEGLSAWERDQIKRRAYALWKEAGCPQGRDRELWEQAELQILKGRSAA